MTRVVLRRMAATASMSQGIFFTQQEELELGDEQPENQPEPGGQREYCEKKISMVGHRLTPGGNLEDYAKRLPLNLHGLCIISRLALTCAVDSGTYPYQGQVEKMSNVELLIAWLHM